MSEDLIRLLHSGTSVSIEALRLNAKYEYPLSKESEHVKVNVFDILLLRVLKKYDVLVSCFG